MKKALLIIGIVVIVVGVLSLLMGLFIKYISAHTLDGSVSLYNKQKRQMMVHLIAGIVFVVVGLVCLIIRKGVQG